MREIVQRLTRGEAEEAPELASASASTLTLPFDDRRKSRQRVLLDDGEEAALLLERGTVLKDGDRLRCRDGSLVLVRAAPETLSRVLCDDPLMLTRAAYHLGNRHIPVAIDPGGLSYQHDHVLDDLVRALGLRVVTVSAPFQPEGGAYGGGHRHGHDHDHGHGHAHGHDHDHDHDHRPFPLTPTLSPQAGRGSSDQ